MYWNYIYQSMLEDEAIHRELSDLSKHSDAVEKLLKYAYYKGKGDGYANGREAGNFEHANRHHDMGR